MSDRITLGDLEAGQAATVVLLDGGHGFQHRLRSLGIREGKRIVVRARQPFGGPVVVEVDRRQTTIGRGMAAKIMVEPSAVADESITDSLV